MGRRGCDARTRNVFMSYGERTKLDEPRRGDGGLSKVYRRLLPSVPGDTTSEGEDVGVENIQGRDRRSTQVLVSVLYCHDPH